MARKNSTSSSDNTSPQDPKPFAFIPTAGMAKAAETARARAEEETRKRAEEVARKKAEEEARKKAVADQKAADVVVGLISAIGMVNYSDECLELITKAKKAYLKLSTSQKNLVSNTEVLIAAEKKYAEIETAVELAKEEEARRKAAEEAKRKAEEAARKKAEEEARKKAETDQKVADSVIQKINAIGLIQYGKFSKIQIARSSYNALNKEQKKLVNNLDILVTAEKQYNELQLAEEEAARKKAEEVARKATEEERARRKREEEARRVSAEKEAEARKRAEEVARKKAEEEARKKAEQEVRDKEIEAILLAYCKKKGSSLTDYSRDHVEYDMPRKRYDEIYEYVLRKNKEQRNFSISLNGYDYFFYAASNNKSYGISAWRKINTDGLWDINEKKNQIGRINKIFAIGLVVIWSIFLLVNAIYTWVVNSWLSCIIWAIITFAVFFGILSLVMKTDEEHPIEVNSLDAGAHAHIVWRICWVLGLSVISEIIMIVIFAQ